MQLRFLVLFSIIMLIAGCGGGSISPNVPVRPIGSDNSDSRGRQIVDEYLKRDAAPFRKNRIRFTVTEEGEAPKVYEIDTWRKQMADETTTLTQIVAPPEDSGTSTLTLEAKGKKTVVVTYAASRDEFRETDTNKMFFGGLTAGELLGEWEKFDYKFIGESEVGGGKVFEIEGKLKPDADSVVSRTTAIFRADNYVLREMHLFGGNGEEIRTYKTVSIKDDRAHPYASRVEVDNRVYRSHIVIDVLNREYPANIDDSMFAKEKLKLGVRK